MFNFISYFTAYKWFITCITKHGYIKLHVLYMITHFNFRYTTTEYKSFTVICFSFFLFFCELHCKCIFLFYWLGDFWVTPLPPFQSSLILFLFDYIWLQHLKCFMQEPMWTVYCTACTLKTSLWCSFHFVFSI